MCIAAQADNSSEHEHYRSSEHAHTAAQADKYASMRKRVQTDKSAEHAHCDTSCHLLSVDNTAQTNRSLHLECHCCK
jgi:hypothetical protein